MIRKPHFRCHVPMAAIASAMLIVVSGCYDDFDLDRMDQDQPAWTPDIALPLVFSSLNSGDILLTADSSGSYTEINDAGFVSIVYRSEIFSIGVNDMFNIPSVTYPFFISPTQNELDAIQTSGSGTVQRTNNVLFMVSPGGEELDSVTLGSGQMGLSLVSGLSAGGTLTVQMPQMRLNGAPFERSYPIGPFGSVSDMIDLVGYSMDLSATVNGFNQIAVVYRLDLTGSAGLSTSQEFQAYQSFNGLRFSRVYGYFAQKVVPIPEDTVPLDLFQNALLGSLSFVDPKLTLTVINSFGIPMNVTLDHLRGYSPSTGTININQTALPPNSPVGAPTIGQLGQSVSTPFQLNLNNSNVLDAVNQRISGLVYQLTGATNPGGYTQNFATDQSRLKVVADLELPLWGRAKNFTVVDTVDFPSSQSFNQNISEARIRAITTNGFPVEGELQLIFLDENHLPLDSLAAPPVPKVILAGLTDAQGRVTAPMTATTDYFVDALKAKRVFRSRYMIIKAVMNTNDSDTQDIRLYDDYRLDVKLGIEARLNVNFDDLTP